MRTGVEKNMEARVSIDKFVVEYADVTFGAYYGLVIRAAKSRELFKQTMYHGGSGYSHELHLRKENGVYLHVFYRNFSEPEGISYTLRIETRPEYYVHFKSLLDTLRRVASGLYFVSCDIAYDVQNSMENVVVFPNDRRRKMRHYKETRYFGKKEQRKQNGYCRTYNKQLELLENQQIVIDYELTRIEIVYKPAERVPIVDLLYHLPQQNKQYFGAVITDWGCLPEKRAEQARKLRDGEEVSPYIRKMVKETLTYPYQIDFNELARERWKPLLEELCGILLGQQEPQVQERQLQMEVTYTVYDVLNKENDRKNEGCADFGKYRILRNNKLVQQSLKQYEMTELLDYRKRIKVMNPWILSTKNFLKNFFVPHLRKLTSLLYVYCK